MLALCALAAPAYAEPLDPHQLPSSCDWVVHLDVDELKRGSVGQSLWQSLQTDHRETTEMLTLISGTDVINDIASLGFAGLSQGNGSVFYITGRLNAQQLANLATFATDHLTYTYRTFTVHKWYDANQAQFLYAALVTHHDDHQRLFIADQQNALQDCLDVASQAAPSLAQSRPALTEAPQTTPSKSTGPAAALRAFLSVWPENVPGLDNDDIRPLLRHIDNIDLKIREDTASTHMHLNIAAKQLADVQHLQRLAEGFLSAAVLLRDEVPAFAVATAQTATTRIEGNEVVISFHVDSGDLMQEIARHR
jgi:hypothetical protein